jgi:hypothetical protein
MPLIYLKNQTFASISKTLKELVISRAHRAIAQFGLVINPSLCISDKLIIFLA